MLKKLDNNDEYHDPWKDQRDNRNKNREEKKSRENGPPDLEDMFFKLLKKIKSLFNKRNKTLLNSKKGNVFYISFTIAILFLIVWIGTGFYTIKESDRGVVLRFGKFHGLVQPGLNWKPTFIDSISLVNVETVRELAASGMMLTSDENVVRVEMNVQYRVTDPKNYLFSVTNADDSLRQATDSALRGVIGKYTMDRILTEGRTLVRNDTQRALEDTILPYNMGITLLDVNFQAARPPEEVKAAFDDAIAARENEQQYIREAEAYANEVQPRANGRAQRILEEAKAYKIRTILETQGEIQRFSKILSSYRLNPNLTRERLYIDTMEKIFRNTRKIFTENGEKIHDFVLFPQKNIENDFSGIEISKHPLKKETEQSNTFPNDRSFSKMNSKKSKEKGFISQRRTKEINREHIFRDERE